MKETTTGERLKKARGNKTVEEVAKALGITRSAITNYENDLRVPKDSIKVKIANYYGTDVQNLFFANF